MPLEFLVPGDLRTATGGYVYDRRMVEGLSALGWRVTVHLLDASFPQPTRAALEEAASVLAGMDDDALVVIDGLALGAMPELIEAHTERLRIVALIHHPLAAETGLARDVAQALERSERRALRAVRAVIVTSRATKSALSTYGVPPHRIAVVEPGADTAPLARGRGDGTLSLMCVATITPRKGHRVLVEALAPLASYRWHLHCVGSTTRSPETVQALRAQLERTGLAGRVTLTGEAQSNSLADYYDSADVFVLPTLFEGYGMAVAEALARGLPVISTRTGAIEEMVSAQAGLLVRPGSVEELRCALERVMSEPGTLAQMAEGARQARERLPRWPNACARMGGVLTSVAR